MSNPNEGIDLSSPEFIPELTPEQIAAAGEKKKYIDNAVYYLRNTATSIQFSKPKLKNGELNADAKGAIWLNLELTPVRKDGSISTKLYPINYVKVMLYERLNERAMRVVGYTDEQIAKVQAMSLPDTFNGFRRFAQAMFPTQFGRFPQFDKETKSWSFNGSAITEVQAAEIKEAEKAKVLAWQREVRATNGKCVQGKEAFWNVYDETTQDGRVFPSARFPSATPHKNKEGIVAPVMDPDKDFAG